MISSTNGGFIPRSGFHPAKGGCGFIPQSGFHSLTRPWRISRAALPHISRGIPPLADMLRFASEVFALAKVKLRSRAVKFVPKAQVKFWLCQSGDKGITRLSPLHSSLLPITSNRPLVHHASESTYPSFISEATSLSANSHFISLSMLVSSERTSSKVKSSSPLL